MTRPETTTIHLHVKNPPAKDFVHQPNVFRKKCFYLTVVNCYAKIVANMQGSKFTFDFGSTCATRCKFLGTLPKF